MAGLVPGILLCAVSLCLFSTVELLQLKCCCCCSAQSGRLHVSTFSLCFDFYMGVFHTQNFPLKVGFLVWLIPLSTLASALGRVVVII